MTVIHDNLLKIDELSYLSATDHTSGIYHLLSLLFNIAPTPLFGLHFKILHPREHDMKILSTHYNIMLDGMAENAQRKGSSRSSFV